MLRDALPTVVTLPQLFRRHGYDVESRQDLHYDNPGEGGTAGQDDNPSWDETYNPSGRDKKEEHLIHSLVEGKFGGTLSWYRSFGEDNEYTDGMVAQLATNNLKSLRPQTRRSSWQWDFSPAHPFLAPDAYFEFHDLEGIVVPSREEEAWRMLPLPSAVDTGQIKPIGCTTRHCESIDSGLPSFCLFR